MRARQIQATPQIATSGWKHPGCGVDNTDKFYTECGAECPESSVWKRPNYGMESNGKFYTECGSLHPQGLR